MKIIIADDNKSTQFLLKKILLKASYKVETYDNGEDVYEALLKPDSANIIILDWMMPKLNGPEVIRKLANKNIIQRKYVLILSSKNRPNEIAEGLLSGASDYLSKPINSFELLARIKVAERILAYQKNMRTYAKKMESLARRNKFLNKLSTRELLLYNDSNDTDNEEAASDLNVSPSNIKKKEKGFTKILSKLIDSTFKHYGFTDALSTAGVIDKREIQQTHYCTWIAIFLPDLHRWIDIGFCVDIKSATAITNQMIQSSNSTEQEIVDTLAEMTHIIETSFKQILTKSKNTPAHSPYISRCFLTKGLDEFNKISRIEICELQFGDVAIQGYISDTRSYDTLMNVFNIKEWDIISEEIRSKKNDENILIENCSVFDPGILENIQFWLKSDLISDSFRVTQASKIAHYSLSSCEEL